MNGAGRCWVTRIGTPIFAGKSWNKLSRAWIPPVDAPIASMPIGSAGIARSGDMPAGAAARSAAAAAGRSARPSAAQLAQQDFGKAAVEPAGAGLGQGVGGAQRQRGDGFLGAFLGERGDDHHPGAARPRR